MIRPLPIAFVALFALALAAAGRVPDDVLVGTGEQTYRWVSGWAKLPDGVELGNTHGCLVVDKEDRVYVNTDTERAVIVLDADGRYLRSFGADLKGGLHGMVLALEDGKEFLYAAHLGRQEVLKLTLEGEIVWTIGIPAESGLYADPSQYRPTSVAVAPNGDLYVADGYGLSWIHVFGPDRKYKRSFGGNGVLRGQFRTCHGITIDEWNGAPALFVADRENARLQVLDLEGRLLAVLDQELRRPCHVHCEKGELLIPDLAGRVTVLDKRGGLVAQLGDNPDETKRARNDVPREEWRDGEFLSPHCARWDSKGNLYVVDWNALGRVSKLERVRR